MPIGNSLITAYTHRNNIVNAAEDDDMQWRGDNVTPYDPTSVRMMFHNVRGIQLNNTSDKTIEFLSNEQVASNIDILGISEVNLDTTNFRVYHQLQQQLAQAFPGTSTMQFNSSPAISHTAYKPGGTGLLTIGQLTSRLDANGKGGDPLGRWSHMHFRRKNQNPVTVISAYQVCVSPTNQIGNTAWHQQKRRLIEQGREDHPRKAFIDDLIDFIRQLQANNHDIILGGDFNETLDAPASGLLRLATNTHLVDPWDYRFPTHPKFNTQKYGSKRIDSILLTPRLLPAITGLGYAPFDYIIDSDHRATVISFDTKKLFGDEVDMLLPGQF
jgi:exonuclease III